MKKSIVLSILLILALFNVLSCAPAVSQQEYDKVTSELSEAQSQLALQRSELAEAEVLQAKYDELSDNYDAVRSELEILQAEYGELGVKYDELGAKYDDLGEVYDELSRQYNVLTEGTADINEEDVEQAVFELINQERRDNGLNELEWNHSLYLWAKSHSRDMATRKRLETSEYDVWQDFLRAAGYSTVDRLAGAALTIWRDSINYERNMLVNGATVGAVGAYKSGEVFYITYFIHII
jgi:uncharacterized protein YkwD